MGGILYIETKTNFNQSLNGKFLAKGKTKEIKYPGCQEELEQIEKLFPKSRTN